MALVVSKTLDGVDRNLRSLGITLTPTFLALAGAKEEVVELHPESAIIHEYGWIKVK